MKIKPTEILGVYQVEPVAISDERGWFMRVFCADELEELGFIEPLLQINHSFNERKHTFRGMHYQVFPNAENKLVRCIRGSICDVVLDLREGSKTFLKYQLFDLSEQNKMMLVIPRGVAHGFLTLEDKTEVLYHHTAFYAPETERGVNFKDPRIHLVLPAEPKIVSQKDANYPLLSNDFKGLDQ